MQTNNGDINYYYGARQGFRGGMGRGMGVPSVQYGQEISLSGPQQGSPTLFNARAFKIYGAVLALLAAATLSLGIADVVLTKEAYCNPWSETSPLWCSTTKEPYIWTWVAPGIWASVPIFFAGIFAMCLSTNPGQWTRVFALLIFLSAIVFAPGMCVLSSIEVWRGSEADYNFYKLNDGLKAGNIMPSDNPYQAKFAIPLVIAILAAIMFFLTIFVSLCLCCCMNSLGIYLPDEIYGLQGGQGAQVVQQQVGVAPPAFYPPSPQRDVYYPSRPQIRNYYGAGAYRPGGNPYAGFGPSQTSLPTRYNSGISNELYGNFASNRPRNGGGGGGFASDFFKPNPAYFWQ